MGTQGNPSELRRIEVTVLKAHNLPNSEGWLSTKRRYFVTVSDEATSTTRKSESVKIEGQTVKWNEQLGPFFLQPSSRLTLRLFAERSFHRDTLVGTQEIPPPLGSTPDLSISLGEGNDRHTGQATLPVMIDLKVAAPANAPSTSRLPANPTNLVAANAASTPRLRANPTNHVAANAASTPSLTTNYPNPVEIPTGHYMAQVTPEPETQYEPKTGDSDEEAREHKSGTSTLITTEPESTIDDIVKIIKRFRILSVGRSGVGKSSLINSVFGIDSAHVEEYKPGEAEIQQEFVSQDNQFFVLHDSKGFEPGDLRNFDTVRNFVRQRSRPGLPMSERIHALWLCTETPTAGGRVFETGDEKLLQFAHENQVPILIVFTQYDRLVRTKEAELRQKYPDMEATRLRDRSVEDAKGAFGYCLKLLERSMERLKIPMPSYAKASVRPGHREDVSELVQATRDIVKKRVKGDAWVLWAIAQRKNLPIKIDACVIKGISYYRQALIGTVPESGQLLLHHCLEKGHNDILTCWNFKDEVLNSPEFRRLILCLVQEVHTKPSVSNLPDVINQFLTLVTSAPSAPPDALPRLTNIFEHWLSTAAMENTPSVQRLLIAYTVDLISVLRELFDITLSVRSPGSTLTTTWTELRGAFEAYEFSRKRIHARIRSKRTQDEQTLTADDLREKVRELLQE